MDKIYFDNAASTKPSDGCIKTAEVIMKDIYGNPSSLHNIGLDAENAIKITVKQLERVFPSHNENWIFTSGGTESNNTAIFSGAYASKIRGKRVITTKAEHPSVLSCFEELKKNGFDVIYLSLSEDGSINPDELKNAVNDETLLVSIANVNSETGVIQPVGKFAGLVKEKNPYTLFHCDAVQSFGKLDIFELSEKVDYISVSAHKIHGLKGCGALYIREGTPFKPLIIGGGQQRNRRSGTENTISIAAFGSAIEEEARQMRINYQSVLQIKDYIVKNCNENIVFNGYINQEQSSPYILNMSVLGVRSEVLLHALENEGIYVSAGSACSSRQKTSGVIEAYGLGKDRIGSAIRLSFCKYNTIEEAEKFVTALKKILPSLRKYGGLKR